MRQINSGQVAWGWIAVQHEGVALAQVRAPVGKRAEPQLRPLEVDQDADRAAGLLFERADHRHPLAHRVMRGVTHVDAENVDAGGEQPGDGLAIGGGGAEGGDDLDAAAAMGLQWRSSQNGGARRQGS